ncbi:hypothetical protein HMPREF1141_2423 [Clostridium sp. MSTE9]|nr:hypothetical protein HMPREF1141_2423 [Clostridium sp. MSTE9]
MPPLSASFVLPRLLQRQVIFSEIMVPQKASISYLHFITILINKIEEPRKTEDFPTFLGKKIKKSIWLLNTFINFYFIFSKRGITRILASSVQSKSRNYG